MESDLFGELIGGKTVLTAQEIASQEAADNILSAFSFEMYGLIGIWASMLFALILLKIAVPWLILVGFLGVSHTVAYLLRIIIERFEYRLVYASEEHSAVFRRVHRSKISTQ